MFFLLQERLSHSASPPLRKLMWPLLLQLSRGLHWLVSSVLLKRLDTLSGWHPTRQASHSHPATPCYLFSRSGETKISRRTDFQGSLLPLSASSQRLFMNKMVSPCYTKYGFHYGIWGASLLIASKDVPFSSAAQRPHSHQSSFNSLSYQFLRCRPPGCEAWRCLGKPTRCPELGGKVRCPSNARGRISLV